MNENDINDTLKVFRDEISSNINQLVFACVKLKSMIDLQVLGSKDKILLYQKTDDILSLYKRFGVQAEECLSLLNLHINEITAHFEEKRSDGKQK